MARDYHVVASNIFYMFVLMLAGLLYVCGLPLRRFVLFLVVDRVYPPTGDASQQPLRTPEVSSL